MSRCLKTIRGAFFNLMQSLGPQCFRNALFSGETMMYEPAVDLQILLSVCLFVCLSHCLSLLMYGCIGLTFIAFVFAFLFISSVIMFD